MKITKQKLVELNACTPGIEMFTKQFGKEAELKDAVQWCITQDMEAIRYANWLIVRVMTREQYLSYAVFAAKKVLDIFEKKYPDDKRPRLAIEAAEACIKDDSEENKKKARAADAAASYAASASAAASYAAASAAAYYAAAASAAAYYAAASYAADAYYAAASYAAASYAAASAAASYAAASYAAASYYAAARKAMRTEILKYGLSLFDKQCSQQGE